MPYQRAQELPASVRDHLPAHAQEIFMVAFNSALERYQDHSKRRDKSEDPEEIAFQVAWAAVKKKYRKRGDRWVEK